MRPVSQHINDLVRLLQENGERVGVEAHLATSYAWQLLEHVTRQSRAQLLAKKTVHISLDEQAWLDRALDRLRAHEPLQYILGTVQFLDLTLHVRPPLLIPRPETEAWVAELISYCCNIFGPELSPARPECPAKPLGEDGCIERVRGLRILDIGTGSGCIALALAHAFPQSQVLAVDIDERAVVLTHENALCNNLTNVTVQQSDVYGTIAQDLFRRSNAEAKEGYGVIVSNPPYVHENDWVTLDPSVTGWENKQAIVAEQDGLAIIKKIISDARTFLMPQGILALEIDAHQGLAVQQLFYDAGFAHVIVGRDGADRDRYVWGMR